MYALAVTSSNTIDISILPTGAYRLFDSNLDPFGETSPLIRITPKIVYKIDKHQIYMS